MDDAAIIKFHGLFDAYHAAKEALALAAQKFSENVGFLPGTGGGYWKKLFLAARDFALVAYSGTQFGELGPDGLCPLCQQLRDVAERLMHFEKFIQ